MRTKNRIAITGLGIVAPNGIGVDAFWESVLNGKSGIGPISLFDPVDFPVQIAGEVSNFDVRDYVDGNVNPKRMGRHTQLALAATRLAMREAGLEIEDLQAGKAPALVMGVSSSAFDVIEKGKDRMASAGVRHVSPYVVSASQPNAISNVIAQHLAISSYTETISSACTAGLMAIGKGADLIRSGREQVVLAGGTDAPVTPFAVASFAASGMIPTRTDDPATASRPFDLYRSGGVMSEGACIVVLESLSHALARGARPIALIRSHGVYQDEPGSEPASGLSESMASAVANAGLYPEDIDYICAHGPSDPIMDRVEMEAVKKVFGAHAYSTALSSIKGVTGNPLSAAGPMSLSACALAFRDGYLPPTANFTERDPECDLDCVPNQPRAASLRFALVNIHGMGGGNCTVALEKVPAA
ncbi:MAG: 3-oxoacyl-[acyl-carrier-protein] synthase II [Candidatus Promineifilaceae bacterium]|jgi:3-oxoacyl-[acyl-carrier-protein] synthase II